MTLANQSRLASAHEGVGQLAEALPSPERGLVDQKSVVVVMHGLDVAVLHLAVRTLERCTGRPVLVLPEAAEPGSTMLETFEAMALETSFVVVILTADNGTESAGATNPRRGPQDLGFELGYLLARFGRERVAVLVAPEVDIPSDAFGVAYIRLDGGDEWRLALGRELQAAGIITISPP